MSTGRKPRRSDRGRRFQYFITAPWRAIEGMFARRRAASSERIGLWRRIALVFYWPVHVVISAGLWIGGVFSAWMRQTNARFLLQGLPAVIVGLLATSVSAVAYFTPQTRLIDKYNKTALTSLGEGQLAEATYRETKSPTDRDKAIESFQRARVCYERLMIMEGESAENRFRLAESEDRANRLQLEKENKPYVASERVFSLMSALAPDDKQGYGRAHLWRAIYFQDELKNDPKARLAAERHLKLALNDLPEGEKPTVHHMLARYFFAQNRPQDAMPHLEPAAAVNPELRLTLARVLMNQGQKGKASAEAETVRNHLRRKVELEPLNAQARVQLAESLATIEDYEGARRVIIDAMKAIGVDPFRPYLGDLYGRWLGHISRQKNAPAHLQIQILEQGLKVDPGNRGLNQILIALSRRTGKDGEQARKMMQTVLASGVAPAALHLTLGMEAYRNGEYPKARLHLEQALKLDQQSAEIANNLAWLYANTPPFDYNQALSLSNAVVGQLPNVPQFRDTRGQILVKMGRYVDALVDLEMALPTMATDIQLHKALESCYAKLGVDEMATIHKEIVGTLEEREKAAKGAAGGPSRPAATKKDAPAEKKGAPKQTPPAKEAAKANPA